MCYVKNLCLSILLTSAVGNSAFADESASKSFTILGKEVSAEELLALTSDDSDDGTSDSGIESTTTVTLFGKEMNLVTNSLQYTVSEDEGLNYANVFYVNGVAVAAEVSTEGDDSYGYSFEIPDTSITGEVFKYSASVVKIKVDTGLNLSGDLGASISSDFIAAENEDDVELTDDTNLVSTAVNVDLSASGYVEGVAKILFLKAGVGGSLDLIEGNASAAAAVTPLNIENPEVSYGGSVNLLTGNLYSYLGSGSKKWWTHDIYESNGYCFSFGDSVCE